MLVSGNSHDMKYTTLNNKHFINPGSMTGAYSTLNASSVPSFIIIEIKQVDVTIYFYSLVDDELKCDDARFER